MVSANTLVDINTKKERKARILSTIVPLSLLVVFCSSSLIFADSTGNGELDTVKTSVLKLMQQGYTFILSISSGALALILIIGFFTRMFSSNQRAAETATTWMKRAGISYVCILAIGEIIKVVQTAIGTNMGYSWT